VPDERLGQRVGAAVEAAGDKPDARVILAYCRRQLAAYKVPERIVFVDRLPRNAMGKVRLAELGALLVDAPVLRVPSE